MGELFANMEKMDIQEERRKRAEAEQKLAEARQKAAQEITNIAGMLISAWKKLEMTKEEAAAGLHGQCGIPEEKAAEMVAQLWDRDQG